VTDHMTDPMRRAMPASGSTLTRGLIYFVVLAITVGGVWFVTRGRRAPEATTAGHNHGATAAGDGAAKAVMLSAADQQRIGVTFAVAELGSLAKDVRTVGQVTFDETRLQTISPKIDGWVDKLFINATGQPIAAGEPLLTIYSPMLVTAQEELLLAKRLARDVSAASTDAQRNASDLLNSARRRLAYWDIPASEIAIIERTEQVQKTLTLRSTASGYVLQKNVVAGQKIMAGDALYRVADLSTVWVEGEVFEQDIANVRTGQVVHADFDALPGRHLRGQISYIYPTLDPQTRTVRVRVVLSNPGLQLKPGMYATIVVAGTARTGVLTVPRSAVLSTGERSIVFVRDTSGHLTPREVALGGSSDARIEILRGLRAGETVVSSATFLVDAESNLGTALGGMGNMPGMDVTTPPTPLGSAPASAKPPVAAPAAAKRPAPAPAKAKAPMADMPGMDHSAHTTPKKP